MAWIGVILLIMLGHIFWGVLLAAMILIVED
jgi:hypothetical protein